MTHKSWISSNSWELFTWLPKSVQAIPRLTDAQPEAIYFKNAIHVGLDL